MSIREFAQALLGGEAAPPGVLGKDWEEARKVLLGTGDASALPAPLALAVLEAAVASRAPAPAEQLSTVADREVAKAARRALYRLRSAGVAVSEPPRAPARPEPAAAPEPAALPAFITLPDGLGQRALLVAQPIRSGVELVEALLSDEVGVLSLSRAEMGRGAWRKFNRGPEVKRLLPLSAEEARALLAEALRCNFETRTALPPEADVALGHLGVEPAKGPLPPLPAPEEGDGSLAVESGALHAEPEVAGWLPPEAELKRLALRVDEVRTSPLALTPEQQADALRDRIRSQAEDFFDPARMQLYARRLWSIAPALEARGAGHAAAVARATARRMFHGAAGLFPPFAEQLFGKVLALMAQTGARPGSTGARAGASQAGARPDEPSPAGERRSPGGLILP